MQAAPIVHSNVQRPRVTRRWGIALLASLALAAPLVVSAARADAASAATPDTFTATPPMNAARYNHTATRLDGPACRGTTPPAYCGKVLVTGGEATYVSPSPTAITPNPITTPTLNTTELYDPVANTWTAEAPMNVTRSRHTATLLDGTACHGSAPPAYCGQVLVVGGSDSKYTADTALQSAELYNPAANTWTLVASTLDRHQLHTANLVEVPPVVAGGVNHDEVLVVGGFSSDRSAELYDPLTNTWTHTGSALLGECLAPQLGGCQTAFGHARHTATNLPATTNFPDGTVLVVGGCVVYALNAPACPTELFNPATNDPNSPGTVGSWTELSPPTLSTFNHTATLLTGPNCGTECGQVLMAGGSYVRGLSSSDGNAVYTTNRSELYNPATGSWTLSGNMMTSARTRHTATQLASGQVLVTGGKAGSLDADPPLNTAERYDPMNGTWTPTAGTMTSPRAAHTATLLTNGQVLLAGGFASGVADPVPLSGTLTGFTPINSAELYIP